MKFKRLSVLLTVLTLIGAVVMLSPLVSCAKVEYTFRLGHMGTEETVYHLGSEFFAKRLEELTNGRVKVEIYPRAELGEEWQMFEQVMKGVTDATIVAPGQIVEFIEEITLFSFPFMFKDFDHWERTLTGPVGEKVAEMLYEKTDAKILGYYGGGVRRVVSRYPIRVLADFKNFLMRLHPSDIQIKTWSKFGIIPTVVAYPEIYSALRLGVIDGLENEAEWVYRMKFYEQAPYYIMTNHEITIRPLVFSGKTYRNLPADIQAAIDQAGRESAKYARDKQVVVEQELLKKMIDEYGLKAIELPPEDMEKLREMTIPVREAVAKSLGIEKLYREIMELAR